MSRTSIKPILNGVKLIPGQRYLINIDTKCVFPYNPDDKHRKRKQTAKCMARSSNMREFFYDVEMAKKDEINIADMLDNIIETDVDIERPTIVVDPDTLTPSQKRKITMENKKKEKE